MAINNIPRSYQVWANVAATPPDFNLDAGWYGLTLSAAVPGTGVTLQKLLPDGVTYVSVTAPIVPGIAPAAAAGNFTNLILPAGQYRLAFGTTTGLTGEIALISRGGSR